MDALTAQLEAALVRELRAEYARINDAYFKNSLRAPTLELVMTRMRLGQWVPATRTLEISRPLVLEKRWGVVLEVLKHEIAHQYVHEVLGEHSETPHGATFRKVCERLGIDGRASGMPAAPLQDEERIVERIAKLLALAESPNRHEAEAAAVAAQRLMLKYNVEHAVRSDYAASYVHSQLGKPTGRVNEAERIVAGILGRFFFVEVIWVPVYRPLEGKRGSVVEICGTRANLAIAEYVHGFLNATAERLWDDHKRSEGIASNRERVTFLAGVMAGFAEKLSRQARVHAKEGLVWVKDGDLVSFFRRRHPYVRHIRHAGQPRTETYAHGREAGKRIVLHRGVNAAAVSRGKLLPP